MLVEGSGVYVGLMVAEELRSSLGVPLRCSVCVEVAECVSWRMGLRASLAAGTRCLCLCSERIW